MKLFNNKKTPQPDSPNPYLNFHWRSGPAYWSGCCGGNYLYRKPIENHPDGL